MKTEIGFLHELREDLMDAAAHEAPRRRGGRLRPPGRARHPMARWKVAVTATTAIVVVAGVIGYAATRFGGVGGGAGMARLSGQPVNASLGRLPYAGPVGPGSDQNRDGSTATDPVVRGLSLPPSESIRLPDGVPDVGANVVKTGEITLEVPDAEFPERFAEANAIAERYGGYVQTSTTSGTRNRSGSMVMRVPADRFALVLGDLRALGTVLREQRAGVDVTARFVDLGARLRNAEAQAESLRRLLEKAPNVTATLRVNDVLSDVELRIEELRGQLRLLQDRADLATVRLEMSEKGAELGLGPPPVENPDLSHALEVGVAGFLGVLFSIVVGIGYLLPVLALAAVVWFVVRQVRRARRTRRTRRIRGAEA